MRKTGLRFIMFLTAALLLPAALFAQKKESLAVFAFTGGDTSDGEYIASNLSRQATLRNAFNKTTLITRATIATMNFEQRFQRNGLTDADTIFELGKALNASHVIAGYITRLGTNNLVLVSIMDVESLQQIAGYYKQYRNIEEVDKLIPEIASQLAKFIPRNTRNLPGLSVPPFVISRGVDQNDAMALAQILSCDLANLGKYAVLPRTDSIDKILEEQRRQRSGITDQERIKRLGAGRNAQYVLSGSVEKLGTLNKFAADILDIVDGSYIDGYAEQYRNLAEGFTAIPKLAVQLSGQGPSASAPAVIEYIARGDSYIKEKDYALAIAEYTQAIRLDSNNVQAYNKRGNAYINLGNSDRAIADYTQAIILSPNDAVLFFNRGFTYEYKAVLEDGKNYALAIADYTQVITLNPNYSDAYRKRGGIYSSYYTGNQYYNPDRAIADYTQVIRLNPNDLDAYMSRALNYSRKQDYNRAIADYTQVITLNPNYSDAYTARGQIYGGNHGAQYANYDKAIADYTQLIRLNPNDEIAYMYRASFYSKKKDYDRAIPDYETTLRINPKNEAARYGLDNIRAQQRRSGR